MNGVLFYPQFGHDRSVERRVPMIRSISIAPDSPGPSTAQLRKRHSAYSKLPRQQIIQPSR